MYYPLFLLRTRMHEGVKQLVMSRLSVCMFVSLSVCMVKTLNLNLDIDKQIPNLTVALTGNKAGQVKIEGKFYDRTTTPECIEDKK